MSTRANYLWDDVEQNIMICQGEQFNYSAEANSK